MLSPGFEPGSATYKADGIPIYHRAQLYTYSFLLEQKLDPDLFGFWLFNDDEMYESLTGNMELYKQEQAYQPKYVYPSPVPSFTGKWAPSFASTSFSLIVMLVFIFNSFNLFSSPKN